MTNQKAEQQEPVARFPTRKWIYDKLSELGSSITSSCCGVPDKRCSADEWILQTVQIELLLGSITAPPQRECKECGAKQAEIDRLMLEFCPDEMTPKQLAEWCRNQKPQREWVEPSDEQIAKAVGDEIDGVYLADFRAVLKLAKELNS